MCDEVKGMRYSSVDWPENKLASHCPLRGSPVTPSVTPLSPPANAFAPPFPAS